jgi:hypothetical protein
MDQRITGSPVADLHGVKFRVDLHPHVQCHILPETLAFLRDRFANGLTGSFIKLFHQLREQILRLAMFKLAAGRLESNGWLCLKIEDAIQVFGRPSE